MLGRVSSPAAAPEGLKINLLFDQSTFVKRSITEAEGTLLLAAGLVVVIIFVFLRNFRATIIPTIADFGSRMAR